MLPSFVIGTKGTAWFLWHKNSFEKRMTWTLSWVWKITSIWLSSVNSDPLHVCVHAYIRVCVHTCACMWMHTTCTHMPVKARGQLQIHHPPCFLTVFYWLRAHQLGPGWPACLCAPSAGITSICHGIHHFVLLVLVLAGKHSSPPAFLERLFFFGMVPKLPPWLLQSLC